MIKLYKEEIIIITIGIGILLIISITFYQRLAVGKVSAASKPPYSIEQCDQWLMNSAGAGSNQERTTLATLASACYLSQRKE
jgi:hypothetical protein